MAASPKTLLGVFASWDGGERSTYHSSKVSKQDIEDLCPYLNLASERAVLTQSRSTDAIAFNQAGASYRGMVQLAFRLDVNEFRGIESPQLVVEQIAALSGNSA